MGMYHKLNAYFAHWGHPFGEDSLTLLAMAVVLSTVEFVLGIYLFLGIRRRFTAITVTLLMTAMTALTVYVYVYDPVPDCGCFGAAFTLTNGETLAKNIVLTAASIVVLYHRRYVLRLVLERNQWITSMYAWIYIMLLNLFAIHYLPPIDFTSFEKGTDMRAAYYNPDASTPAALLNFTLATPEGELLTDSILNREGITLLLTLPDIATADDGSADRINDLYDACRDSSYAFFAVASYNADSAALSSWVDKTGAAYPILLADADQLKAMVRANPGLMAIRNGVIKGKWSNNNLPSPEGNEDTMDDPSVWATHLSLLKLVGWFIFPLLLVIFIDRAWVGSKFYRHYIFKKRLKQEENEKENRSR